MKRLGFLAGAATLAIASAALAHGMGMLDKADSNKDGRITQQEMQTMHADHFAKLDLNKDGFIDAGELLKARDEHGDHGKGDGKGHGRGHHGMMMGMEGGHGMMMDADADKNGKLSKAEFVAGAGAHFDEMDFNKDGYLDKSDHEARKQACESGKILCGPMARFDENKDGRISKAEFVDRPHPMFEHLDANKDGVLDKTELDAARQMREGMGKPEGKMGGMMEPDAPPHP